MVLKFQFLVLTAVRKPLAVNALPGEHRCHYLQVHIRLTVWSNRERGIVFRPLIIERGREVAEKHG